MRAVAAEKFDAADLPNSAEEIWRYSRIDQLDLAAFAPLSEDLIYDEGPPAEAMALLDAAGPASARLVLCNGRLVHSEIDPSVSGLVVGPAADTDTGEKLLAGRTPPADVFGQANEAFGVTPLVLSADVGARTAHPVVIVHWVDAENSAQFPRLLAHVGESAALEVIEMVASPDISALVCPVTEFDLEAGADVGYLCVQQLGTRCWQVAHRTSRLKRSAKFRSVEIALGGYYARVRTDSAVLEESASSLLRAAYFGNDDQMHDFRTLQDHEGRKTTSDLLFKGAVDDRSRSVYSGLIRIVKGAAGSQAFQTNRNLVLSEGAHADSVPNLEIDENDVRCSHASAVGPVDDDQLYYLESRGVPTEIAERLIVGGFFDEILELVPSGSLREYLAEALDEAMAGGEDA